MRPPAAGRPAGAPHDPQATGAERVAGGGRTIAGRYRLDRLLGKGSMGTVWAAYDETLHRRVAIKEIYVPNGTPESEAELLVERTLREARAIAQLSHPNVITLYDILTLGDGPVIVMEVLAARSLGDVLKEVGPLTVGQAATVGLAVAAGLEAAHAAGITHRDVKPGNVLIGGDGRIKLTDFGIARSAGENPLTATGLLLGSPAYIAPEVASGATAGAAADAWGLGALLFACVEGRPPFDKNSAVATLMSVVSDPVPALQRAGVLTPAIEGLLAKDPSDRMTVADARETLRPLADDPVETRLVFGGLPTHSVASAADAGVIRPDSGLVGPRVPPPRAQTALHDDSEATAPLQPETRVWDVRATTSGGRFTGVPQPPWAATEVAALAPLPTASRVPATAAAPPAPVRPGRVARRAIAGVAFVVAALLALFGVRAISAGVSSTTGTPQGMSMSVGVQARCRRRCTASGATSLQMIDGPPNITAAAHAAAAELRRRTGVDRHDIAVVLGSGWRTAADQLGTPSAEVEVAELPGFTAPVVTGHGGQLRSIPVGERRVLVLLGRTHLYEGLGVDPVVHGVRTAAAAGVTTIVLTNAAGGLRPGMSPGQPVLISDHLNLTGRSPLVGATFVDLTDLYSARLRRIARELDPSLTEGVYAQLPGPHFETPAEIRMLQGMGADLVGMSTGLEAIAARAAGVEVLGLSLVTNLGAGMTGEALNHLEVLQTGAAAADRMGALLAELVRRV